MLEPDIDGDNKKMIFVMSMNPYTTAMTWNG